jgi:hypothetical protein
MNQGYDGFFAGGGQGAKSPQDYYDERFQGRMSQREKEQQRMLNKERMSGSMKQSHE